MTKDKSLESDFNLVEQRPLAGEIRSFPLGDALFFSPKPIPSAKVVSGSLGESNQILAMNDVCMDVGQSNHGKAFQVQLIMFCVTLVFLTMFIALCIYANATQVHYDSFVGSLLVAFTDEGYIIFLAILVLFVIGWLSIVSTSLKNARQKPIRFNRQRREICYFDEGSKFPVIVPWEEVVSWVSMYKGFTGTALVSNVTFGLALPDLEGKQYWMFKKPVGIMEEGQRSWEIIRCYMEEGPEYWATMAGDESRKMFDETRLQLKQDFRNGPKYLVHKAMSDPSKSYLGIIGYYLFNILSGWKLPYLVSEWDSKISMAKFPDEINKWSEPIPEHEWAKPSKELLKQKARAEAHYAAGGNLATLKL